MKEYQSQATIQAPIEKIWSVLTTVENWPEWDPNCVQIQGTVARGAKLKVYTKLSPGRAFPLRVTELTAPRKMVWSGGMPFGLFKGERTFSLTDHGHGKVSFVMREVFSGPMLALIGKSIPDMTEAFEQFVQGLKNRAEGRA